MAFCINCGNPLSEDARFCAHCGTRVEPAVQTEPTPVAEEPAVQPVYSPVAVAEPVSAPTEPVFVPEQQPEPEYAPPVQEAPVQEAPQAEPVWQPEPQQPVYEGPIYADPVEPEYVPPVKTERKPLIAKKPLGLGKKILVVFLSLLAFIFGVATVVALCLRFTLTADNVAAFIENVDVSQMEATTIITNAEQDTTLADWLIDQLEKKGIDCSVLNDNDVEDFLDACIRPFVRDEAQEFAAALLTGEGKASVTMEEIRDLVDDSREYLYEEHGVVITDENADTLVTWIDGFGVTEKANTRYLEKEYGDALDTARMVLSWAAVAVFGFLTFLMLLFIWLTNKSLIRNLNTTGTVATLVGGIFAVSTVIQLLFPGLLMTICGNIDLIYAAVNLVITSGTLVFLSTLGGGIFLLLLSRLLQIKVRK